MDRFPEVLGIFHYPIWQGPQISLHDRRIGQKRIVPPFLDKLCFIHVKNMFFPRFFKVLFPYSYCSGHMLISFLPFGSYFSRNPPLLIVCTLGISPAPAFVDDFPSYAHKFNQRTFHVRLINLCTSDKKSSHKIRHKETPRVHYFGQEDRELARVMELAGNL